MKKTANINGVQFELLPADGSSAIASRYSHRGLFDCYAKPSNNKTAIWEYWKDFANELGTVYAFHVESYNCKFFTIEWQTDTMYFRITPAHNYVRYLREE